MYIVHKYLPTCSFTMAQKTFAKRLWLLPPPHTDAFFMRSVAIRHDASMHIRGRIVTERTGTDEKRVRVGRAFKDIKT